MHALRIFFDIFRKLQINLLLLDVWWGIPKHAKYLNDVVTNKNPLMDLESMALNEEYSFRVIRTYQEDHRPWEFHPTDLR